MLLLIRERGKACMNWENVVIGAVQEEEEKLAWRGEFGGKEARASRDSDFRAQVLRRSEHLHSHP